MKLVSIGEITSDRYPQQGRSFAGGRLFDAVMRDLAFTGRRVADFGDLAFSQALVENPGPDDRLLTSLRLVDLAFCSGDRALFERPQPLAADLPSLAVTLGAARSLGT